MTAIALFILNVACAAWLLSNDGSPWISAFNAFVAGLWFWDAVNDGLGARP